MGEQASLVTSAIDLRVKLSLGHPQLRFQRPIRALNNRCANHRDQSLDEMTSNQASLSLIDTQHLFQIAIS